MHLKFLDVFDTCAGFCGLAFVVLVCLVCRLGLVDAWLRMGEGFLGKEVHTVWNLIS